MITHIYNGFNPLPTYSTFFLVENQREIQQRVSLDLLNAAEEHLVAHYHMFGLALVL